MSCRSFIPSEIIEAILVRSPAKSLARFRSVSKEWNSLISDPRFIKTHTHQLKPTKKLLAISKTTSSLYSIELIIDKNDTIPAKEITFGSPRICWSIIMGSCNGLVLARDENCVMFLTNPTTHDLWKLPVNPFANVSDMYYASYGFGFGYDPSTDDYKVVCICISYRCASYGTISIYSLRNNSWRKLPDSRRYGYDSQSCALVNGNCHWLANYSTSIIVFSFVDELFTKIKVPSSIGVNDESGDVVEFGGRLGMYLHSLGWGRPTGFELWVMQEYGDAKSWTRVFSHKDYMRPKWFLDGSDRDIVFHNAYEVGVFNMDEGRRRDVRIINRSSGFTIQGSFGESIESIKRIIKTP